MLPYEALCASAQDCGAGVCSLVAVGVRMWAGLHDGRIRVWVAAPGVLPLLLGDWQSHGMGVIGLVLAGTRVSSLGADGSIKAWAATAPCEEDADARRGFTPSSPAHCLQVRGSLHSQTMRGWLERSALAQVLGHAHLGHAQVSMPQACVMKALTRGCCGAQVDS